MLNSKFDESIFMAPGAIIYWQKYGYPKFRGSGSHKENHQQMWIQQIYGLLSLDLPNIEGLYSWDHGRINYSGSTILIFTSFCCGWGNSHIWTQPRTCTFGTFAILDLGYDRNGSIPSQNRNRNFGIPILVGLTGTGFFRITSGSGQTGTGIFIL
jgi:hypothetical protein